MVFLLQVVRGEGVDRHLLGLKLIALENGIELPDFFKDPAYTRSVYHRLSTSQVRIYQQVEMTLN